MRGQAADYDGWRQLGLEGWGWDDVLPAFLKHEDHISPPNAFHGSGGEWRVEHPRIRWDILDAVRDAAEAAGIRKIDDFNTGDNEGSSYFQVNQKRGRRWSAARGFEAGPEAAEPAPGNRRACGADLEGRRAAGVRFTRGGQAVEVRVGGEVILAAAPSPPQLLELSGIGDGGRLSALGIPVVHHAPGVGENLQDHLQLRPVYKVRGVKTLNDEYAKLWKRGWMALEYALFRRGPLTMAPSQLGVFAKSSADYATANLEFHFQPLSLDKWGEGLHPFGAFTASVCNLRPSSRGSVHATSPDPRMPPAIRPNYLSTEEDRRVAVDALRLTRGSSGRRRSPGSGPRNTGRAPISPGTMNSSRRRARSARRSSIRSERPRWGGRRSFGGARRAAAGARHGGVARHRRFRHAAHHLRQHQFPHPDDRRERRRDGAAG